MATKITSAKLKTKSKGMIEIKGHAKAKFKTMKTRTFPITFIPKKRDLNDLPIENILERNKGEYREKYVSELLSMLMSESNSAYHEGVLHHKKGKHVYSAKAYPKTDYIELGKLKSDEDINRELDISHATEIFNNYNEQYFQPIYCIKTPNEDKWTIVNGQHTATSTAAIVQAGLMYDENDKKVKSEDWKKFKVLVIYVETEDRSIAREAFALLNGEMSKKIEVFDKWKQHYLSVRLDQSANPKYKHTYNLIKILKDCNCTPLPADHDDIQEPGAITHLSGVEALAPTANYVKVKFVFQTRDKFWNNLCVDNAELGFYGTLFDFAQEENIDMKDKKWQDFLQDLHASIHGVYRNMSQLKSKASKAYKQYRYEQFTDRAAKGAGFSLSLYFAYQVYIKLGGKFVIKALKDLHVHKGIDAIEYLDVKAIDEINKHLTSGKQLQKRSIVVPKK